jgi:hypothetical protein
MRQRGAPRVERILNLEAGGEQFHHQLIGNNWRVSN